MGWTLLGDGPLEHKHSGPTLTVCVVGDSSRWGPGGRRRSALTIRPGSTERRGVASAGRRRQGGPCPGCVLGGAGWAAEGPPRRLDGGVRRAYTKKVCSVCWKAVTGQGGRGRRPGDGRGLGPRVGAPPAVGAAGSVGEVRCGCCFGRGGTVSRCVARSGR